VLIASNAAGSVQHWHMTSGKCLHSTEDENNQIYALDYNSDGSLFATAGKDITLRIFDEATKSLVTAMKGGNDYSLKSTPGHSNRIFAVKFFSDDENMVVSGGWDNTVSLSLSSRSFTMNVPLFISRIFNYCIHRSNFGT
jgi:COMPASS component SWD3